jgi:hypothetical protein
MLGIALFTLALFALAKWSAHVHREATLHGRCLRQNTIRKYLAYEGDDYPDRMRVVAYRQVAEHVYEVTTESAKHGRVTQRVLVLPSDALDT